MELKRHLSPLDTKKEIASHTPNLYTQIRKYVQTNLANGRRLSSLIADKKKKGNRFFFFDFRLGFDNMKNGKVKKLCSVVTEVVMVKCSYMSRLEQAEIL